MFVFALLGVLFAVFHLPVLERRFRLETRRDKAAWALGITLVVAGSLHFLRPAPFLAMMPPALPWPGLLVAVSGVAEMGVGAALLTRRYRRVAAWTAVLLLIAVFPANVYAAVSGVPIPDYSPSPLYRWFRLPMQAVLIGWALAVRPKG